MHVWIPLIDNRGWLEILWSIVQPAFHFKTQRVDRYVFKRPDFLYCPDRSFNSLILEFYGVYLFSFCILQNKSNLLYLRPCSINICIREYWFILCKLRHLFNNDQEWLFCVQIFDVIKDGSFHETKCLRNSLFWLFEFFRLRQVWSMAIK